MNLSIFWRLQNLVTPELQRVIQSARNAQNALAAANQRMQNHFNSTAQTANTLRKRIEELRANRDNLRIGVDTRQITAANREIAQLERQLNRVEGRTKGFWERIGGMRTGAAAVAVGMGVGAFGSLSKMGMDREVITARFEQFTKDQKKATNMVKELNKYADVTPYDNADVLKIGSKIAMNFSPAEVMDKIKMIGDIAGGDAQRMESIQLALSQTKALGNLQGQELNQFADALVPLREYLAKIKNVKVSKIMELVEARKISYNDVEAALKAMTAEGGIFNGFMDKLAKTTQGKWSTLVGSVKNKLTEMSLAQNAWRNKAIDWANRFVNSMKPIEDALGNLGRAFQPVIYAIRDLLVHIGLINPAGDSVQQLVSLLTNVFNILATAIRWAGNMLSWVVGVFNAIPFSKYIAQFLMLNLALKVTGVFNLASGLLTLGTALSSTTGLLSVFRAAWLALNRTFVLTPIGIIITAIVALVAAIYYAWTESSKFREVVYGLWGGIKELWSAVAGFFMQIWQVIVQISTQIANFWLALITTIQTLWSNLVTWFKGTTFGSYIINLIQTIAQVWGIVITKIAEVWQKVMSKIKTWWDSAKDYIFTGFRVLLAVLTLGLSEIVIAIFKKFKMGYAKGTKEYSNQEALDNYKNNVLPARRNARRGAVANAATNANAGVTGFGNTGQGAGTAGGITDTVEGAKSRTLVVNINKGLIETSNIIVDNKGTGLDIERQVLDALNRILLSSERLAFE